MRKYLLGLGLLASVMAFAVSNAEKQQLLNRYMGPVASRVGLGDLVMGATTSVYVVRAGDTMTGRLTLRGAANGLVLLNNSGNRNWQISSNEIASNTFDISPSTTAGGTTFATSMFRVATTGISTPGRVTLSGVTGRIFMAQGANTSIETVTLSGTSTLISNTTVTASSYPFPVSVGASNVAPWLIGISSGVGYSLGASGAGSAKVVIFEGQ